MATFPNPNINLRDYREGQATFDRANYINMPKTKRWFHIYFEMNQAALSVVNNALNTTNTNGRISWYPNNLSILGVLVKDIQLPNFKFDTKRMNQYNRWSLNVNKIDYEPVDISFWDDSIGQMTGFWYAYYSYMVQDPNYSNYFASQTQGLPIPPQWDQNSGNASTGYSSLYNNSTNWYNNYGLDTAIAGQSEFGRNQPFFKSIRIYQFNRSVDPTQGARYNEFVLVNPIISGFHFDQLAYADGEFMANRMTVDYETVLFNNGLLNQDEIASWSRVTQTLFDNTPSPLGTTAITLGDPQLDINVGPITAGVTVAAGSPYNVLTVKSSTSGTNTQIDAAAQVSLPGINTIVSVPFIANNFGEGGNPPNTL
jgi:hypothetical protein